MTQEIFNSSKLVGTEEQVGKFKEDWFRREALKEKLPNDTSPNLKAKAC